MSNCDTATVRNYPTSTVRHLAADQGGSRGTEGRIINRVTIADIAAQAHLSKGAVSYALNGLPGVSDATRARVQQIARDLSWTPNPIARALSGARSNAIGLVLARPARMLGTEPFYMEFIAGVEEVLSQTSTALLLQVVGDRQREIQAITRWAHGRQVDAVIVVDPTAQDPRIPAIRALGIPALVVGVPAVAGDFACVWTDDAQSMAEIVRYLYALGHRRIAHVAGPADLAHVELRTHSWDTVVAALGLRPSEATVIHTDFSGEAGAQVTLRLLAQPEPPTAIIYDNDVMAVAGLSAATAMGSVVPDDLSIVAWDDSPLCNITHPTLTALSRDIHALGAHVARRLQDVLAGTQPAAHQDTPTHITARGSTAPSLNARNRTSPLPTRS